MPLNLLTAMKASWKRGWYTLDIKPRFSLQEAATWAAYSKPVKQRSELELPSFPPSCRGAGISPTGLSSGALTPTLIASAASNLDQEMCFKMPM